MQVDCNTIAAERTRDTQTKSTFQCTFMPGKAENIQYMTIYNHSDVVIQITYDFLKIEDREIRRRVEES
jgi:hypothetical protein